MRKFMFVLWLAVPILAAAAHLNLGEAPLARDRAAELLEQAAQASAAGDWEKEAEFYRKAREVLPAEDTRARQSLSLAEAKVFARNGDLPQAQQLLDQLLQEVDGAREPALARSVRAEAASACYHTAWLMRLEGASAPEWTVEAEHARQHFRLLAEEAAASGDSSAGVFQKNLEAAIRLQQMDLTELQGLPLPKDCQGCKNVCKRRKTQRENPNKREQPGEREKEAAKKDARQEIKQEQTRDAGLQNAADGSGS